MFGLSREPSAVSFISPKVFALCQEDDGECDRAVSAETRCEFICCSASSFVFHQYVTSAHTQNVFSEQTLKPGTTFYTYYSNNTAGWLNEHVFMKKKHYMVFMLHLSVSVGSDWEVCKPGCLFAHVHCAREVGTSVS